jgi:two-component system, OmpR family, response regulator
MSTTGKDLRRILHVEDEPDIQTVGRIALEMVGGFVVEQAQDGLEALDKVATFVPDLVLLDVMMPRMDGPSVLRALKGDPRTSELPVILMTAKVQPYEVAEYLKMGAMGVIPKPFDPMSLASSVRDIWAGVISAPASL